jgi:hypothetical protein
MNARVWSIGLCILVLFAGTVHAKQDTCKLLTTNSPDIEVIKPDIHDAATIGYFAREIENGGGITRFLWSPDDWEADAQKLTAENKNETDPVKQKNVKAQISKDYLFAIKKLCAENSDGTKNARLSHDVVQFIKGGGFLTINPQDSLDVLSDAITKDPYNFDAYREKIKFLNAMGEFDNAKTVEKELQAAQARQLEQEAGQWLPVSPVIALLSILIAVIAIGIRRRQKIR